MQMIKNFSEVSARAICWPMPGLVLPP